MHDQTNPSRPVQRLGADAIYAAVLVGVIGGLLLVGVVLVPVIRLLVLLGILSCVGFFLAVAMTSSLGYLDVPAESPRIPRWMFIAGVSVGLIAFAAVFGPGWLAGFLFYVASIVGILVLMERRRRLEGEETL